jgi:uncharacterized protein YuzE
MTVTIDGIRFDSHEYDDRGDVLYLSVRPPREAARTVATPEGHAVDYDESGAVIGMVLVNVRFLLERDGAVTVTMPARPGRRRTDRAGARGGLNVCDGPSAPRQPAGVALRRASPSLDTRRERARSGPRARP